MTTVPRPFYSWMSTNERQEQRFFLIHKQLWLYWIDMGSLQMYSFQSNQIEKWVVWELSDLVVFQCQHLQLFKTTEHLPPHRCQIISSQTGVEKSCQIPKGMVRDCVNVVAAQKQTFKMLKSCKHFLFQMGNFVVAETKTSQAGHEHKAVVSNFF